MFQAIIAWGISDITLQTLHLLNKSLVLNPSGRLMKVSSSFTDWVNRQEPQTDNYEASLEEMKQKGLFK